jgi:hypothetical protein
MTQGRADREFTVVDDSCLLGIVDCAAYPSFVDANWTYDPRSLEAADRGMPHVIVEIEPGDDPRWSSVAWASSKSTY